MAEELADRVVFVDVECEESPRSCRDVRATAFPFLLWMDGGEKVQYTWNRDRDSLVTFIWKQLNGNVQTLEHDEARRVAAERIRAAPSFIAGEGAASLVEGVARAVRGMPNLFFIVPGSRSMTAITARGDVEHTGGWTHEALLRFFWRNAFPFLGDLSLSILRQLDMWGQRAMVRLTSAPTPVDEKEEAMLRLVAEQFPVLLSSCNSSRSLCGRFGVRFDTDERWYVIFDARENIFWWTVGQVNLGWLEQVKNGGVRASGPGTGWFAPFVEAWLEHEANGRPAWLIMAGPLLLLGVLAVITAGCMLAGRRQAAPASAETAKRKD